MRWSSLLQRRLPPQRQLEASGEWADVTKSLGLEGITPHDLRRTYGSLARLAGADLRFIQKAIRHESITTTARIYAHLYDDELGRDRRGDERPARSARGPEVSVGLSVKRPHIRPMWRFRRPEAVSGRVLRTWRWSFKGFLTSGTVSDGCGWCWWSRLSESNR